MRQWLILTMGGLLWLAPVPAALALGIADPRDISALGRPLHVVLPLTDVAGLQPQQITVKIADDAAYRATGLERTALIDSVRATVVRGDAGLAVVFESVRRVREPFADLLLEITWPDGQWQRDITLLFDPADYATDAPLLGGDRGGEAGKAETFGLVPSAPVSTTGALPASRLGGQAWPARLRVSSGDSLSTLAGSLLPHGGLNRQSLMLALYRANPTAFADNDVDRLRAGATLDVPPVTRVASIPRREAVAALGELSSLGPTNSPSRSASADSSPAQLADTDDGRPTIEIDGSPRASASDELGELQRQIAALEQQSERQRSQILALTADRVRLQAALDNVDTASASGVSAEAAPGGVNPSSEASGDSDQNSVSQADETMPANVTKAVPVTTAGPTATGGDDVPRRASAPLAAPSGTSWLERLRDHLDWIGGALVAVLIGVWGWLRRRQRQGTGGSAAAPGDGVPAKGEESRKAAAPVSPPAKPRRRSRRAAATVATDMDAATISQADIYLAYGRYGEAREWLQSQLAEREDAALRLSLIRALGELRDMEALELAVSGFGDDATAAQRQEGQQLVETYRAHHVEESWQEATSMESETPSVDDVDSLFEAEVSGLAQPDSSTTVADEAGTHRDTADAVRLEPSLQGSRRQGSDALRQGDSTLGDGLAETAEEREEELAPATMVIDYQAPVLQLDAAPNVAAGVREAGVTSSMPEIDFSSSAAAFEAVDLTASSPEATEALPDAYETRVVSAGWDVEEVEFEPPHRDNGRP